MLDDRIRGTAVSAMTGSEATASLPTDPNGVNLEVAQHRPPDGSTQPAIQPTRRLAAIPTCPHTAKRTTEMTDTIPISAEPSRSEVVATCEPTSRRLGTRPRVCPPPDLMAVLLKLSQS